LRVQILWRDLEMNLGQRLTSIGSAAVVSAGGVADPANALLTLDIHPPSPNTQNIISLLNPSPLFSLSAPCELSQNSKLTDISIPSEPHVIPIFPCSPASNSPFSFESFSRSSESVDPIKDQLRALEEKKLLNPRIANPLLSSFTNKEAKFTPEEESKLPKYLKSASSADIFRLSGAIEQLAKPLESIEPLPSEAVRAVVTIALFTEDGVNGAIGYLEEIAKLRKAGGKDGLERIKTHLLTDKSYSTAWLNENIKGIFDNNEVALLEVPEKVERAKVVVADFLNRVIRAKNISVLGKISQESSGEIERESIYSTPEQRNNLFTTIPLSIVGSLEKMMALISKGEGVYDSVNWPNKDGFDWTHNAAEKLGIKLTEMPISEVMENQLSKNIHAAGRFQMLFATIKETIEKPSTVTVDESGYLRPLKITDLFSKLHQDLFCLAILFEKREDVGAFLAMEQPSAEKAALALAKEWASLPTKSGKSFYEGDGVNASHRNIRWSDVKNHLGTLRKSVITFLHSNLLPT
jgi:hypothetical protein